MKKVFIMMAATSMMFASCSNEELIEESKGRPIEFRHAMGSRADDDTPATSTGTPSRYNTGNLDQFKVFAFVGDKAYFDDIFSQGDNNTYSSTTSYYWPGDGSTVSFTAYAPCGDNGIAADIEIANDNVKVTGFTVKDDITDQQDFILGTGTGSNANEATGVKLTFDHMLSQIEVKAKSSLETYTFTIAQVKICNIPNKADYDEESWELTADAKLASYSGPEFDKPIELTSKEQTLMCANANENTNGEYNAILIPQQLTPWIPAEKKGENNTGAYIAVNLTIAKNGVTIFPFTKDGETSYWAAVPIDTEWEAGKKYTYILNFGKGAGWVAPDEPVKPEDPIFGNPITFTVEVSDWTKTEDEEKNMETNND